MGGAQSLLSSHGGAFIGSMGGSKTQHKGALGMFSNPAGLDGDEGLEVYLGAELRYGNPDLKLVSSAARISTSSGSFGVALELYGFEFYREHSVGLGYGRRLSEQILAGSSIRWYQLAIPGYGRNSLLAGQIGLLTDLSSALTLGFTMHLPFRSAQMEDDALPYVFAMGLSFQPLETFSVIADISKESDQIENFRLGLQYQLVEHFAIRLGVGTNPGLLSFGIGYGTGRNLRFDAGTTFHQSLGTSPLFGLSYHKEP